MGIHNPAVWDLFLTRSEGAQDSIFANMKCLALVFGNCLFVSCIGTGISRPVVGVEITTGDSVTTYRQHAGTVSFEVGVIVNNSGREPIVLRLCPAAAEKLVGGAWRQVWVDACLADSPHTIPAGRRFERKVTVGGFIDGSAGPPFTVIDSIAGTYRVGFGLFSISKDGKSLLPLPPTSTVSNSFRVRSP